MKDYQQLSQPLTQEQVDLNKAANAAAQFFDKTNALGHAPMAQQISHQAQGDPWPWPHSANPVLQAEREAKAGSGQLPAPHGEAIDHEAYRQFMRGLG